MESEPGGFRASMTRIGSYSQCFRSAISRRFHTWGLDEQIVIFRKRQSNVAAILCFGSLLTNEVIASSEGLEVKDVEEYLSRLASWCPWPRFFSLFLLSACLVSGGSDRRHGRTDGYGHRRIRCGSCECDRYCNQHRHRPNAQRDYGSGWLF